MAAPQENIPPAADVLGTIGTVYVDLESASDGEVQERLTATLLVAGVFRIWHTWRRKSTEGLPGSMLMLWAICGVPFGVYAIVQNFSLALIIQPQCFGGLTLISWGQTLYYHNRWTAWKATLTTVAVAISFAVMEAVLIVGLRIPYYKGVEWPMMMMAIIASVIQAVGLIPPYFELAKRNGRVIGIDFIFLTIDYAGAFFSLMAIVAQQWFDALGGSLYIVCMLLETGIFVSQAVWLWRVRHVRREAKKAGLSYDAYVAKYPSKKLVRSRSTETVPDLEAGRVTEEVPAPERCVTKPKKIDSAVGSSKQNQEKSSSPAN